MSKWVQHKSGQGEKWELTEEQSSTYGTVEWRVKAKEHEYFHEVPKSEYVLVDPPEQWEDITGQCVWTDSNYHECYIKVTPSGDRIEAQIEPPCPYRVRKIDGPHNGPAFIVERKRS